MGSGRAAAVGVVGERVALADELGEAGVLVHPAARQEEGGDDVFSLEGAQNRPGAERVATAVEGQDDLFPVRGEVLELTAAQGRRNVGPECRDERGGYKPLTPRRRAAAR